MLLYSADEDLNEAVINYINQALKQGQLTVYASVDAKDPLHMDKIAPNIADYQGNIERGDLLLVKLYSFYERALTGDLEPFDDLKAILEEIIKERITLGKMAEAFVIADCADLLSRNEKSDECLLVERWWQNTHSEWTEKNIRITIVCPHPSNIGEQMSVVQHRRQLSRLHSLTVTAMSK
ncbi:MAG: hypothetical protein HMLIMOIP_001280 [Candidatus Nitrosomirales archaeon]|jgi:hypothetical protein